MVGKGKGESYLVEEMLNQTSYKVRKAVFSQVSRRDVVKRKREF